MSVQFFYDTLSSNVLKTCNEHLLLVLHVYFDETLGVYHVIKHTKKQKLHALSLFFKVLENQSFGYGK